PQGAIYYKTANKRILVDVTDELRQQLLETLDEMKHYYQEKVTPKAEKNKHCQRCSLKEQCMPRLTTHKKSVRNYIHKYLME
ncbi:MAG: Dna2/Cas4 domain-containing protein, partial [Tissierellia bacterium]|nr:Dna2/Cas4 domain-containing protein [Tissierellia bacterium]